MKKSLVACLFIFCSYVGIAQLPEIGLRNLDQQWVNIDELKGKKLTVLDFWATWCKPCVSAIPKLNHIAQDFSESGVAFIGVNVDSPRNQSKVKPLVRTLNVIYPIVLDPNRELADELNVRVLPTLVVLDDLGKEVWVHEGFSSGDEKLIAEKLTFLLQK